MYNCQPPSLIEDLLISQTTLLASEKEEIHLYHPHDESVIETVSSSLR
jgi:hypothetical protein